MGTGELTEQPDEMLSKGLGGGRGGEEHVTDEHSGQGENCNTSRHFTLQKQEYAVAG